MGSRERRAPEPPTAAPPTAPSPPAAPSVPGDGAVAVRLQGLSAEEASRRLAAGQGNDAAFAPSRSVWQIVRDNALMSINVIIFAIGVALILMGLVNDAIVTVGLVLTNVVLAVVQELRAKLALDRIALLSRMQATVIRESTERRIDPAEIVLGDLLVAASGDQVMVDGHIVESGQVALDESLLTGESDPISRAAGDTVYSGSFVVSGHMVYEADRVGMASRANQLTAQARVFQNGKTPVQREIDLVLRVMVLLIVVLGGPIVLDLIIRLLGMLTNAVGGPFSDELDHAYQGYSVEESVRSMAVVVSLVPQGIALMLTVTYAMSALRLAGKGALLQQANAIEALSHVDIVCFDKTGTLTTNRLTCRDTFPLGVSSADLTEALGTYAANATSRNRTIEAIAPAYPGRARTVRAEVPFSSAWKWSAITFDGSEPATFVLGAPEVLLPAMGNPGDATAQVEAWTSKGLRVLLLAHAPGGLAALADDGPPQLPASLRPYGLVSFQDELQPDAATTFASFEKAGIAIKIISGDHPETVAALTRQAGFGRTQRLDVVSGLDLAGMDERAIADLAEEGEVFGRITPEQKLELIQRLQDRGHYVAMIGDGVNDVLALKQAEVGIAMESGSQATRAVADLVLLGNAFGVLPAALREGQRIVRSLQDLLKIFLTRSLSVAVLVIGTGIIGATFPVIPTQNVLPALLTVGTPAFMLAIWTKPAPQAARLMDNVLPFVIPAFLTIGVTEATLYISYLRITEDVELARTVMTAVTAICGLAIVLFVRPPTPAWVGGAPLSGDGRVTALVIAMAIALVVVFVQPGMREFFSLTRLAVIDVLIIGLVSAVWWVALRYIWRERVLQRGLGLEP